MTNEFYALLFLFIGYIILSVAVISILVIAKRDIAKNAIDSINNAYESVPTLDINKRLSYNTDLLHFIDAMIELDIINTKRFSILLGQRDKNLDVDKVLADVSRHVFESIKPEVYTDVNNILTPTYIMEYIQKKTFIILIQYINQNNTVEHD